MPYVKTEYPGISARLDKSGKVTSYRLRTCVGRDENGFRFGEANLFR